MTQLTDTSLDGNGNLLAHYEFNTGALVTDSSGNSRTLTNNNTVGETASGKYGYSTDFGTVNSDKYFNRAEDIWNNGAFSFVAWVKKNATSDVSGFFSCNEADTDKQLGLHSTGATNLTGSINRVGVGYDTISGTATWTTGWHHVALTLTTGVGGTLKTYFDGVEVGTGSVTNASGTTPQGDDTRVGYYDGQYFEQYMDDAAFFSDVLTPAEIKELAQEPSSGFFAIL